MDDNQNKKPNVLLVDDDEDIRSTYADAFRQQGFEVREAKDGVEDEKSDSCFFVNLHSSFNLPGSTCICFCG